MRIHYPAFISASVLAVALTLPAQAQLTKNDRKELEKVIPKTVYLRIDLPCVYGKQGLIASWVEPMVDVSPTGVSVEQDEGWRGSAWTGTKRNLFYAFGPNDDLKYNSMDIGKDGAIVLYFEGLGPKKLKKNQEAAIRIVNAKAAADFKVAFDRAFSSGPLQDEHPDWPEDIRKAVGEHRVLEGMTKEQVSCIVGQPVDVEVSEEGGKNVETWHIRQEKGIWSGWTTNRMEVSGSVSQIKFMDGKVAAISSEPEAKKKK
jgi:hypothetical protein